MRFVAVGTINVYQRYFSPYKGFCCAYHYHTGRSSCSEYAKRLVLRRGVAVMLRALPRQFARCKASYAEIRLASEPLSRQGNRENRGRRRNNNDCNVCNLLEPVQNCDAVSGCDVGPCDLSL